MLVVRHRRTNKVLYRTLDIVLKRFDGADLSWAYFGDSSCRPFLVSRWIDALLGSAAIFLIISLVVMSLPSESKIHPVTACLMITTMMSPGFFIGMQTSLLILKGTLMLALVAVGGALVFQQNSSAPLMLWSLGLVASIATGLTLARNYLFQGLDLRFADFSGCCLDNADFSRADLRCADFRGASLRNTIFEQAKLEGAIFTDKN